MLDQQQPFVTASKKDRRHCALILDDIQKCWDMVLYKRFYQLNKVIKSDKFYYQVSGIVYKYWNVQKIIAI